MSKVQVGGGGLVGSGGGGGGSAEDVDAVKAGAVATQGPGLWQSYFEQVEGYRAPDIRIFLTPVHFEALNFMPKKIFERSQCKDNLIARYVHSFGFWVKIKTQELNNLTCPSYSDRQVQL